MAELNQIWVVEWQRPDGDWQPLPGALFYCRRDARERARDERAPDYAKGERYRVVQFERVEG